MAPPVLNASPQSAKPRNLGCVTFIVILILIAVALFFFRDRWLPRASEMLGIGRRTAAEEVSTDEATVYAIPDRPVYHRSGCSLLKEATPNAMTLRNARASGLRRCTKCNPPE
jgi:hypothetical protein